MHVLEHYREQIEQWTLYLISIFRSINLDIKPIIISQLEIFEKNIFQQPFYSENSSQASLQSKIQTLGEGGYGEVKEVMDLYSQKILAVKQLTGEHGTQFYTYQEEVLTYMMLQSQIPKEEFEQYAIPMIRCDHQDMKIFFTPGMCSLRQLIDQGVEFTQEDIIYIFRFLVEFVMMMKKYGYVHNDLKPENILVVENPQTRRKELRIIDFGGANKKLTAQGGYTTEYYLNPLQHREEGKEIVLKFESMQHKAQNDIFSVVRTIQAIMAPAIFKRNSIEGIRTVE